jgi:hypothetical protein
LYSMIVFSMSLSSWSVKLGILGFEGIVPEVVASAWRSPPIPGEVSPNQMQVGGENCIG